MGTHASREQAQTLKAQWTGAHGGERGRRDRGRLRRDHVHCPIAMPADDAEFVAARKLSATEVARAFRVPPWMIGAEGGDSMTYSNTESQALAFVAVLAAGRGSSQIEQALDRRP